MIVIHSLIYRSSILTSLVLEHVHHRQDLTFQVKIVFVKSALLRFMAGQCSLTIVGHKRFTDHVVLHDESLDLLQSNAHNRMALRAQGLCIWEVNKHSEFMGWTQQRK